MRRWMAGRVALVLLVAGIGAVPTAWAQRDRTVILVRHAEAGGDPQNDPPLTPRGEERARALAFALHRWHIDAIIVSNLQRTQLTAAPTARAAGVTPIVVDAGSDVQHHIGAVVATILAQPPGETILVVGHSNTIPAIVMALDPSRHPQICSTDYSNMFVVRLPAQGMGQLMARLSYGAPGDPGAEECAQGGM